MKLAKLTILPPLLFHSSSAIPVERATTSMDRAATCEATITQRREQLRKASPAIQHSTDSAHMRSDAGADLQRQILTDLAPDVAALVTGLGLDDLAPGLAGTLETLGAGL